MHPRTQKGRSCFAYRVHDFLMIDSIQIDEASPPVADLDYSGFFVHEDAGTDREMAERRRDFSRLINTQHDLWHFTTSARSAGNVLQIELSPHEQKSPVVGDMAFEKLRSWFQGELQMTSKIAAEIANRAINVLSVSPAFEFLTQHGLPQPGLPARYVLMVSRSGQVRVAWYAYVTDEPTPGATSSPFVVKLLSTDLAAERGTCTSTKYSYTLTRTTFTELDEYMTQHRSLMLEGVDGVSWEAYIRA